MATTVINIRSLSKQQQTALMAGKLDGYVYIGRHPKLNTVGKWGNKYTHLISNIQGTIQVANRAASIDAYTKDLSWNTDNILREIKLQLKDKILVCWCKPHACHGDVLARIADQE